MLSHGAYRDSQNDQVPGHPQLPTWVTQALTGLCWEVGATPVRSQSQGP